MSETSGTKRLFRPSDDTKIAGVCGGLGLYFGVDPTLVRVVMVVVGVLGFPVVPLLYLLMWAIMPAGTPVSPAASPRSPSASD